MAALSCRQSYDTRSGERVHIAHCRGETHPYPWQGDMEDKLRNGVITFDHGSICWTNKGEAFRLQWSWTKRAGRFAYDRAPGLDIALPKGFTDRQLCLPIF